MEVKRFIVIDCGTLLFSASTEEECKHFVEHPENYRKQYANGIIEVGATPFIVDTNKEGISLNLTDREGNTLLIYTKYGVFEGATEDASRDNTRFYIKEMFDTLSAAKILFNAQRGTQSGWAKPFYECKLAYEVVCEDNEGTYTIAYGVLDSFTEDLEWQGANAYCSPKSDLVKVLVDGEERSVNPLAKGSTLADFVIEIDGDIYHIQEGSGDALSLEDIEDGYIDYIYYDILEDAQDVDSIIDGGCILLKKNYVDLTIGQIVQKVLDFESWSPESNYTQSYRERDALEYGINHQNGDIFILANEVAEEILGKDAMDNFATICAEDVNGDTSFFGDFDPKEYNWYYISKGDYDYEEIKNRLFK